MIIYKVTNIENNKVYIGKTIRELKQRRWAHYDSAKNGRSETNFHRALIKYPKESFIWEIIATASNDNELNELEIEFIKKYDSFKNGYNMCEGGNGGLTYKKGSPLYNNIKHKLGKWKDGNPGSTHKAITKRIETFKSVKWITGESHGNFGHTRNKGKYIGKDNPNAKSITIDGIIYSTITEASKTLNISTGVITYRCKSKNYKTYKYN